MRAIGGAAVVNRLAHFCLEKYGARVTAASRQIARKRYSVANRRPRWRFYGPKQLAQAPGSPVEADLGRDLARSGSNPVNAFFQ